MGWFSSKTILSSVGVGAILVATSIFVIYAFGPSYPARLNASIELERATWLCVFEEFRIVKGSKTTSPNTA